MRYPAETIAAFKRVLRARRDTQYHFTPDDATLLSEQTGVERERIFAWAHGVRRYYETDESISKYLERSDQVKMHQNVVCTAG